MIEPLRRRHLRIWMVITPLLLTGAVAAFLMAPMFPRDPYGKSGISFPELEQSVVSTDYMFNLKRNYSGGIMLEVIRISDINPVSELVTIRYSKPGTNKQISGKLGMMNGKRSSFFNMESIQPPFSVLISDTIKKNILAEINF